MNKIGFAPPRSTFETREKKIGDLTVIYTRQKKPAAIMYNCECRRGDTVSATGFHIDGPELSWEEIEQRFIEFVSSRT